MWKKKLSLKKLKPIFLILLIIQPVVMTAQENYTLERIIQQGLEKNYQLKIVRNRQQMAENMNTAGNAGMLPSVNVGASYSRQIMDTETRLYTGDIRSGDNALSTSSNAFIETGWTIFDGFSMFARRDRLGYLERLSEMDTRYYVEQTISDIAHTWYQLIAERQLLKSYEKTLEISAFRLQLEDQKRQVGTGNALRYHQALIDFNTDSSLVSNQQMVIGDIQIRLNRIILNEPLTNIDMADLQIHLSGIDDMDELLEKSLSNNKDLERARLEEMISEATVRAERGHRYPQIDLFGGYSWSRQTSEVGLMQTSRSFGPNFGVRLRFNLYDGGRQTTRINNMLLEQENATISFQDTRSYLHSELARLINAYENYLHQYRLLQQSLQASERTLEIASRQLQTGAISGFEFRQVQQAALQVENQIIRLTVAMKAIETDVYRITGEIMEKIL
jgi:outer membrane protein